MRLKFHTSTSLSVTMILFFNSLLGEQKVGAPDGRLGFELIDEEPHPESILMLSNQLFMDTYSTFDRALLAEREGKYPEALKMFQACLEEKDYDEGDVLFHCGWCTEQEEAGDKDQALRYYELAAAEARMPECKLNSFFRAGWLLMHQKEHAKAATMFRYAIDYGELSYHKNETYNQSAFWYAACIESQGWYIEAIRWYRLVRLLSPQLDPECRLRELACLNQIGSYDEAYRLCQTFDAPPPAGFEANRYRELRLAASREGQMLQQCLSDRSSFPRPTAQYGSR